MCGAFYPNYFEQVVSDEVMADKEISGYNPSTTVMVTAFISHFLYLFDTFLLCFRQGWI